MRNVILISGIKWQAVGNQEIMPTKSERNTHYWTQCDDVDVVMLDIPAPDTNDVGELKIQIKELKVALANLAYVKDISERNVLKKEEDLTK